MKSQFFIVYILFFLCSCSENKNSAITNTSNKIEIDYDSILQLPNSEVYKGKGYILNTRIAIYNSNLQKIDSLTIVEDVSQVNILEKTKDMVTASGDTINAPCPTANFLKIEYKGKDYIVYGIDIYEEMESESFNFKNDINSISIFPVKNFSIGFFGFGELTSCDDYHPLVVFQNNQYHKVYSIPKENYYSQENQIDYYYLNSDDGIREKIKNASLRKDTIVTKIYVEYQDGYSDYDLNVTKNKERFESIVTNETKPRFD